MRQAPSSLVTAMFLGHRRPIGHGTVEGTMIARAHVTRSRADRLTRTSRARAHPPHSEQRSGGKLRHAGVTCTYVSILPFGLTLTVGIVQD